VVRKATLRHGPGTPTVGGGQPRPVPANLLVLGISACMPRVNRVAGNILAGKANRAGGSTNRMREDMRKTPPTLRDRFAAGAGGWLGADSVAIATRATRPETARSA